MEKRELCREIVDILLLRDTVTRQELLEAVEIRPASLLDAVRLLVEQGLLEEPERTGRHTGRKASPIRIRADAACIMGVELGLRNAHAVCLNARGEVLASRSRACPASMTHTTARRLVLELVRQVRKDLGKAARHLRGIGFADPGLANTATGTSVFAVGIKGWRDLPTAAWLRRGTGLEAAVYNAVMARAFAEYVCGARPLPESLFEMELDVGVGGGFIHQGEPFVGASACAMEVGHLIAKPDGRLCQCGNRGCLEAVAGWDGIRARMDDYAGNGVQTALLSEAFSLERFVECVHAHDKPARALALEISDWIGLAVSTVVAILNPRRIVFHGALAGLGDLLVARVRDVLSMHCLPTSLAGLELQVSALPADASARGAALLLRRKVLRDLVEASV